MTSRQYVLEILDDARNRDELIMRLIDLVDSRAEEAYSLGEKSGRFGARFDRDIQLLHSKSHPRLRAEASL